MEIDNHISSITILEVIRKASQDVEDYSGNTAAHNTRQRCWTASGAETGALTQLLCHFNVSCHLGLWLCPCGAKIWKSYPLEALSARALIVSWHTFVESLLIDEVWTVKGVKMLPFKDGGSTRSSRNDLCCLRVLEQNITQFTTFFKNFLFFPQINERLTHM